MPFTITTKLLETTSFCAARTPPSNYQAVYDDGWFVDLGSDETKWKEMYHNRTVPQSMLVN